MKIAILSFRPLNKKYSKEEIRLVKAARKLGCKARLFRIDHCQLFYNGVNPKILYQGKPFPKYDVLIPRPSILSNVDLHVSIIKEFQLMKMPVVNGYVSITRSKNKLRTLQMLNHDGIQVPRTIVIRNEMYLEDALKRLGGPPVIIKTPFGSFGTGVVLVESKRSVKSAWDLLKKTNSSDMVLIQQYIKESKGKDLRVFVIGGKALPYAMERRASRGEFRSNIELGGKSKSVKLDQDMGKIAVRATKILGLQVAGVDIISTNAGPAVMEVNSNPGFKQFENATGIDVAELIVRHAINYTKRYRAKFG